MASARCPCHVSSPSSSSPSPSPLVSGHPRASLRPAPNVRFVGLPSAIKGCALGMKKNRKGVVTCAVGDVSSDSTTYLIAGAVAITLIGTAYPLLFSRKDLCPECDGAGFIRKTGSALRANAARKDSLQIVCPTCSGLGKIGQVDK